MHPIVRQMLLGVLCLLPSIACCQQVGIALGDEKDSAIMRLQSAGATDITSGIELIGLPNSESPKGLYWELKAYKTVIELSAINGKINAICYWPSKDFDENKTHREESRIYAERIGFNAKDSTLSLLELPGYDLYGWSADSRNWNFALLDYSINRNRTLEEIQNPTDVLLGIAKLESQMSKLPFGTVILLQTLPSSAHLQELYPPKAIIEELRQYATSHGLSFRTLNPNAESK